jgi:hypothetical protein
LALPSPWRLPTISHQDLPAYLPPCIHSIDNNIVRPQSMSDEKERDNFIFGGKKVNWKSFTVNVGSEKIVFWEKSFNNNRLLGYTSLTDYAYVFINQKLF